MTETKPFMPPPIWTNPRYGRYLFRNGPYYQDMKQTMGWFSVIWKYPVRQRYTFRLLKILLIFALIITCIFNFKLAIEAKLRYEQHKVLFSSRNLDEKHSHIADYESMFDLKEENQHGFEIEVLSSKDTVEIRISGDVVLQKNDPDNDRGIHVVTLNQFTGVVMATRWFDTYTEGEDDSLVSFVDMVNDRNRILIFAVKDEASFNLGKEARERLKEIGSLNIDDLKWRNMWAMITNKNGDVVAEDWKGENDVTTWGEPVHLKAYIKAGSGKALKKCAWPSTPENVRRQQFCSKYDGYGSVCICEDPVGFQFVPQQLQNNNLQDVPVAVIASNRPQYLYRMLTSLLSSRGANPNMITVFIDGHFAEPMHVTKLLGVHGVYHTPSGVKNARISQNYRSSLSAIFNLYPSAKYAIILEEDLDISPDLFNYFSQTVHLMEADPSIYCISAWNDQGYDHSCGNASQLYRVETFPGLGWLLSRSLYKNELEPQWPGPEKSWDWDMWMRQPAIRKDRECVIPDVSRTFHFGTTGVNMNSYFHRLYFSRHKLNQIPDVELKGVDSLTKDNYEKLMHRLIRESSIADHTKSPCVKDFISVNSLKSETFIVYLQVKSAEETIDVFMKLAKCLKIWDLDVRGLHKNSFRTYINDRHVVFVAYPVSPYSIYKPVNIDPIKVVAID